MRFMVAIVALLFGGNALEPIPLVPFLNCDEQTR